MSRVKAAMRLLTGAMLVFAGMSKALAPRPAIEFAAQLVPDRAAAAATLIVSGRELALGVAICSTHRDDRPLMMSAALYVSFLAMALVVPASSPPCGCLGDLTTGPQSRSLALLTASAGAVVSVAAMESLRVRRPRASPFRPKETIHEQAASIA